MASTNLVPVAVAETVLPQLSEAALDHADLGMAANTRRAYEGAWAAFESWASSVGVQPLPADPVHVANYLSARAPHVRTSTLEIHLAAIRRVHKFRSLPPPASEELDRVFAGIRRKYGKPPVKKRALLTADVKKALRKAPDTLLGVRDRAILLIAFASGMRRSELVAALTVEQLLFGPEGLLIQIARSKGDQFGKGQSVPIPYGKHRDTCPVSALQLWLRKAAIRAGPVFRSIGAKGQVREAALCDRTIARVIKASAKRAGLDPALFGGHSTRRGSITQAHRGGANPHELQAHARHAKFDTTIEYIEEADMFSTAAAGKLGL